MKKDERTTKVFEITETEMKKIQNKLKELINEQKDIAQAIRKARGCFEKEEANIQQAGFFILGKITGLNDLRFLFRENPKLFLKLITNDTL